MNVDRKSHVTQSCKVSCVEGYWQARSLLEIVKHYQLSNERSWHFVRDESNKATLAQVVQILFLICSRCGPRGFRVHCVPGACALVAALSVAGLPCSSISVRRFLKELIKPFHIRGILIRYQRWSKHVPQHDKRNMERGAWKACFVQKFQMQNNFGMLVVAECHLVQLQCYQWSSCIHGHCMLYVDFKSIQTLHSTPRRSLRWLLAS